MPKIYVVTCERAASRDGGADCLRPRRSRLLCGAAVGPSITRLSPPPTTGLVSWQTVTSDRPTASGLDTQTIGGRCHTGSGIPITYRCHPPRVHTWAEKFESFERINSIRETNGKFDSCNSCKRLVPAVYMSWRKRLEPSGWNRLEPAC